MNIFRIRSWIKLHTRKLTIEERLFLPYVHDLTHVLLHVVMKQMQSLEQIIFCFPVGIRIKIRYV